MKRIFGLLIAVLLIVVASTGCIGDPTKEVGINDSFVDELTDNIGEQLDGVGINSGGAENEVTMLKGEEFTKYALTSGEVLNLSDGTEDILIVENDIKNYNQAFSSIDITFIEILPEDGFGLSVAVHFIELDMDNSNDVWSILAVSIVVNDANNIIEKGDAVLATGFDENFNGGQLTYKMEAREKGETSSNPEVYSSIQFNYDTIENSVSFFVPNQFFKLDMDDKYQNITIIVQYMKVFGAGDEAIEFYDVAPTEFEALLSVSSGIILWSAIIFFSVLGVVAIAMIYQRKKTPAQKKCEEKGGRWDSDEKECYVKEK